jgi:transaldolase
VKFFLDSADPGEIRAGVAGKLLEGVTTTAALVGQALAAAGGRRDERDLLEEICGAVGGPVTVEVSVGSEEDMFGRACALARIANNLVVTLSLTSEGLRVVQRCAREGIKTHVTRCFSPGRAILAARAGAVYVSPFVDPMDSGSPDAASLIRRIVALNRSYELPAEVMVTALRSRGQIVDASMAGAQIASVSFGVLQEIERRPADTR